MQSYASKRAWGKNIRGWPFARMTLNIPAKSPSVPVGDPLAIRPSDGSASTYVGGLPTVRYSDHGPPLPIPSRLLAPRCPGARVGGDQSGLLPPRSPDLSPRHRRLRHQVQPVLERTVLPRRDPA